MGTNKRKPPATVAGGPKERHKRAQRHGNGSLSPQPASGLGAKRPLPKPKDKHHSYLEFVENKDRKKKLDFTNIFTRNPPEGYVFIPVGNPALTNFCKELSREQGVKVYFVSVREPHRGKGKASPEAYQTQNCGASGTQTFANQMSRMGFHFLSSIVDKARECLSLDPIADFVPGPSQAPEPIPESQTEYHAQVDGVLRDLFPRIPNTDRQIIIDHAFTRRERYRGEPPVGLSTSMTLARRVQLAVLAHIRHTHTRRVVQTTCLDFLVKWRGDEETGRDQLEEILREVVVISDSEDDESTDDEHVGTAATAFDSPSAR
ncbi:mfs monocarboxylate transporter protein [Purpureocillium lavendulum]|uniref:Mfs monocarboxylate transporter protein n=1 Tax=Purpureocillium lavendulum TaxID=1247861 RepID=A0AB34FLB2_9HYPO|nr:mfs monocarboxylate transporter protein [Purpureocillium lavendulum]